MAAKRAKEAKRETDLYGPVRDYLQEQGFTVRAEVHGCDVTATREDELVVVELKLRLSLELLLQATQRQRLTDSVYVAVPRPDRVPWKKERALQHLLRRLELGLIYVVFGKGKARVEVVSHPLPFGRRKAPARRRALIREMEGRSVDRNAGGSTRTKIVTAYREAALHIAWILDRQGRQSPKALRAQGASEKAGAILYDNHYGWFDRIDKGVYALSAAGKVAMKTYADVVAGFEDEASEQVAELDG